MDICKNYSTTKWCGSLDGLVAAGVIPDDTPEHLVAMTFTAPQHAKRPRLTLLVERRS